MRTIARVSPSLSGAKEAPNVKVWPYWSVSGLVARSAGTPDSVNGPPLSARRIEETMSGAAPWLVIVRALSVVAVWPRRAPVDVYALRSGSCNTTVPV